MMLTTRKRSRWQHCTSALYTTSELCRHDCTMQSRLVLTIILWDLQVRTLVQQALNKALDQYDLLLSPVAPTTAFKIGEKTQDPLAMYKEDLMTVHLNLAGKLVSVA